MDARDINLDEIEVSDTNARKDLDAGTEDASLDDLANSIKEQGLIQPITVMKKDDGKFALIAGQRRFLACKKLGWPTIPAIVRDTMEDTDATIISLIENVHRADMSPMDKATAYKAIYDKYEDFEKVSKETGMSMATIKQYMKLHDLAPSIQEKLSTAEGPTRIKALSKLADIFSPKEQEVALEEIGGFKQDIQLEILKRSDGNLDTLAELKDEALDGAFDTKVCSEGLCFEMPGELKVQIKKALEEGQNLESLKEIVKRLK